MELSFSSVASNSALLNAVSMLCLLGITSSLISLPRSALEDQMPVRFKARALLAVEEDSGSVQPFNTKEIIGFVIGSISSVLYLCSRLPQMYTNFQRKSTEGVSFFLFALVILGNTTYGISVLVKNPDPGQGEASYIIHHLPWLIGSLGTLSLDLIVSFKATFETLSCVSGVTDSQHSPHGPIDVRCLDVYCK
ncbi:lysosomal amino acid transporter 1 homolog [Sinocyclocheilus grahami]|uniref:lysosomal amino acid transporter 1 homolog n=1 Tax=Sinocyclocheilus grahami TaxID=75366 RepID=UPI0007AD508B|nr:PREDICTED: lysosomal amino acid transporter 1 homolog [Sinocyclocheilus grahami]